MSKNTPVLVDQTPPAQPTVNSIADNTTQITGTAEAESTVTVQSGSKLLGTTIANSLGEFTVILTKNKQPEQSLKSQLPTVQETSAQL